MNVALTLLEQISSAGTRTEDLTNDGTTKPWIRKFARTNEWIGLRYRVQCRGRERYWKQSEAPECNYDQLGRELPRRSSSRLSRIFSFPWKRVFRLENKSCTFVNNWWNSKYSKRKTDRCYRHWKIECFSCNLQEMIYWFIFSMNWHNWLFSDSLLYNVVNNP